MPDILPFPAHKSTPPAELSEEEQIDAIDLEDEDNKTVGTWGSLGTIRRLNCNPRAFWRHMEGSQSLQEDARAAARFTLRLCLKIVAADPADPKSVAIRLARDIDGLLAEASIDDLIILHDAVGCLIGAKMDAEGGAA